MTELALNKWLILLSRTLGTRQVLICECA